MCHDDGQASSCELVDHGERWLLMAHDRVEGDEVLMTHEFLALMLGVRRAGVTGTLQHFEIKGMVETARGAVTVKDREGLQECANGLYGTPEAEFERLLGKFILRISWAQSVRLPQLRGRAKSAR